MRTDSTRTASPLKLRVQLNRVNASVVSLKALVVLPPMLSATPVDGESGPVNRAPSDQTSPTRQSASKEERSAVRYLLARTLESQGRYGEAREEYVVLVQGQGKHRDVADRLARLPHAGQDDKYLKETRSTRFGAFWRGCEQFLRGAHR